MREKRTPQEEEWGVVVDLWSSWGTWVTWVLEGPVGGDIRGTWVGEFRAWRGMVHLVFLVYLGYLGYLGEGAGEPGCGVSGVPGVTGAGKPGGMISGVPGVPGGRGRGAGRRV